MTLLNITLLYLYAAKPPAVICIFFMFQILEGCIDLCIVSHMALNSVLGWGMDGKNASTVWKVSVSNNWITQPTMVGTICFSPKGIFCSNFQRANIYWKCPSCFLSGITLSVGIFGRWLFGLTFVTVRNSWDNYTCTVSTFNVFSYLKQLQSVWIVCIGAFRIKFVTLKLIN